jgi:hypothetical protein
MEKEKLLEVSKTLLDLYWGLYDIVPYQPVPIAKVYGLIKGYSKIKRNPCALRAWRLKAMQTIKSL